MLMNFLSTTSNSTQLLCQHVMVLKTHFNQAQFYIRHSRQGMWCGLCLLRRGTSEAEVKRQGERGMTSKVPAMTHWTKKKVMSSCEDILMCVPTSLPEPAPTKGEIFVLTFKVLHPY